MIVALIGYGLIVSALAALGAWLVERAQVACGRPRKVAWIGGIVAVVLVPALVFSFRGPAAGTAVTLAADAPQQVQGAAGPTVIPLPAALLGGEAYRGSLNDWLAALWALSSAALVGVHAFSARRLARRARSWRVSQVDAQPVCVAPDIGPAVFGWLRSRVVFPCWLTEAPEEVQRLALAHERAHLDARDPQLLGAATLLAALLPWNLPLFWMLRRLRFAMEVDCDARVIHRGADPNDYGLALLYVSERQARAPITAIALIERKSQLERRINFMFATPRRYPAVIAGLCLGLAGYCLAGAARLQAPDLGTAQSILKPPPGADADSPGMRLGRSFERLLRERYPELLAGNFTDTPVIVALLNDDLTVALSAQVDTLPPGGEPNTTPDVFAPIGLTPEQVPYTGAMNVQISAGSPKYLVVLYTERGTRDEHFVSKIFPDTRKLDRELFLQQFPDAPSGFASGQNPWLLVDRDGKVLRKGVEPISEKWDQTLRRRFKVTTQEMTVTSLEDAKGDAIRDEAGKRVHLHVVWLAPGSSLPAD